MSVIETPIAHQEAARDLVEKLRALQGSISGFAMLPKPLDRQVRPRGHRLLPDVFFHSLASSLETSPQFAAVVKVTPAEIRDMLRFGEAYLPVAEELERFARAVRFMVAARRANTGKVCMAAYRVAQGLNLVVEVGIPVPEAETLKRAVTRRRGTPATPTPPEGTPVPPSSSP